MHRRRFIASLPATGLLAATSALAADFDTLARPFLNEGFNGTVAVGHGGRTLHAAAYGLADAEAGRRMTTRTRFETGSVSKWLASIVVLRLCDEGRLNLDTPIITYLPSYRADTGQKLTLRRLLNHSSGLPNQIDPARKADPGIKSIELDQMEAVRRYASGDLAFAPGSAWDYSHSNWILAKAVVEQASGETYAQLIDRIVVKPLRLHDSGLFHGEPTYVPHMAVGYETLTPVPVRKPSAIPDYMAMAGGFYASAADMVRVMHGVLSGGILSLAAIDTLMKVEMPDQHYALGGRTRIETIGGQPRAAAWEDGSNGGFRMVARRVLADGYSVVVMNNACFDYMRLGALASALLDGCYA